MIHEICLKGDSYFNRQRARILQSLLMLLCDEILFKYPDVSDSINTAFKKP